MNSNTEYLKSITLTSADTEYEFTLPKGTGQYVLFTNAAAGDIRLAFSSGNVAGPTEPYIKIINGKAWFVSELNTVKDRTLYLASSTAGLVVNLGIAK